MKALLRVAGAFALASATVVSALAATPGTARACSCISRPLSEYANEITAAFVGTQVSRDTYDEVNSDSPIRRAAMVLEVELVYKGEVGPRIEIHSNADGPACGIDFGYYPGAGVVAFESDGRLWAGSCSNPVRSDELEEVFGPGHPPNWSIELQVGDRNSAPVNPQADGSVDVAATDSPGDGPSPGGRDTADALASDPPDNGSTPIRTLASALVVSVAAVLAVWLLVSRRRARRLPPAAQSLEEGS